MRTAILFSFFAVLPSYNVNAQKKVKNPIPERSALELLHLKRVPVFIGIENKFRVESDEKIKPTGNVQGISFKTEPGFLIVLAKKTGISKVSFKTLSGIKEITFEAAVLKFPDTVNTEN